MRIDAYAQVQQLYGNKKTHKVQKEHRLLSEISFRLAAKERISRLRKMR